MAQFTRYKPRRWQPEFDLIVLASFQGLANTDIGLKFGYTKEHISNILCSEQAQLVRNNLRDKINKESDVNVTQRMSLLSEKALSRLEAFMDNDKLAEASPFLFVDRAFKALQVSGGSLEKKDITNKVEFNQVNLGNDVFDRLTKALDKSERVQEIHKDLNIHTEHSLQGGNSTTKLLPILEKVS